MATEQGMTTESLRDMLFKVLKGVQDKTVDVKQAKVICELAGKILQSADLEIEVVKTLEGIKNKDVRIAPFRLSTKGGE